MAEVPMQAGEIKKMVDAILVQRSRGSLILHQAVKTRLILKGIQVDRYDAMTPDDPSVIAKLREIAQELQVVLE